MVVHETRFVYDGEQIVLQFDENGGSTMTVANLSHRYLWGPATDQLLSDEQVTSVSEPGTLVLPLTDNVGTVRDLAICDLTTGTTSVVNHLDYSSFGQLLSQTKPATGSTAAVDCLFGFTGRPLDTKAGLQNNTNRWYDSSIGRWESQDPTGFTVGDDTNEYRYCGNSPANETDPRGEGGAGDLTDAMVADWERRLAQAQEEAAKAFRLPLTSQFMRDLLDTIIARPKANTLITAGFDLASPNEKEAVQVNDWNDIVQAIKNAKNKTGKPITVLVIMGHGGWNRLGFGLGKETDKPGWDRTLAKQRMNGKDFTNSSAQRLTPRNAQFIGKELKTLVSQGYIAPNAIVILYGCNTGTGTTPSGMAAQIATYSGLRVVGLGGYGGFATRNTTIKFLSFETTVDDSNDHLGPIGSDKEHSDSKISKAYMFLPPER